MAVAALASAGCYMAALAEALAEQGGFSINQLTHLCGVELGDDEISPGITKAAEKANKSIDDLRIITAIILKKRKEY